MIKIVGIRFREGGQIFNFNPLDFQLNIGDAVIVDTQNGLEMGFVAFMPRFIPEELLKFPLRDVVRYADSGDLNIRARQEEREAEAVEVALELIEKHELDMQLISAQEISYDDKLVFYFTADGRVDFRGLVKDLANVFRKRIELRQIGVRDEARRTGGIGRCGRVLCCASFLKDFGSVSVKMAKNQNLSMNPGKISGVCGRLLCCLKYEDEAYRDARQRAPELNSVVNTSYGKGEVKSVDLLKESFVIERTNKDGDIENIKLSFEDRLDEFGNKIDFSERKCERGACSDNELNGNTEAKNSSPEIGENDNPVNGEQISSCCGNCTCSKNSEGISNGGRDFNGSYSSPFDVARNRVNEWLAENSGNSNSSPRYDLDSKSVIDSEYSETDYFVESLEVKNNYPKKESGFGLDVTNKVGRSDGGGINENKRNYDVLKGKEDSENVIRNGRNKSNVAAGKKNQREKVGRKSYRRKHFSGGARKRNKSK